MLQTRDDQGLKDGIGGASGDIDLSSIHNRKSTECANTQDWTCLITLPHSISQQSSA